MNNFLKSAPAWISNTFAVLVSVLIFLNTIGPSVLQLFTDVNCQECITIANTVLGSVATVLGFIKAFTSNSQAATSTSKVNTKTLLQVATLISFSFLCHYQGNAREVRLKNKPPCDRFEKVIRL